MDRWTRGLASLVEVQRGIASQRQFSYGRSNLVSRCLRFSTSKVSEAGPRYKLRFSSQLPGVDNVHPVVTHSLSLFETVAGGCLTTVYVPGGPFRFRLLPRTLSILRQRWEIICHPMGRLSAKLPRDIFYRDEIATRRSFRILAG